jgi:FkbH-like protein
VSKSISEIVRLNREHRKRSDDASELKIKIISNIVVQPLPELLAYDLREIGINSSIMTLDYNQHCHSNISNVDILYLIFDLNPILESTNFMHGVKSFDELEELKSSIITQLKLFLKNNAYSNTVFQISRFIEGSLNSKQLSMMLWLQSKLNSYLLEESLTGKIDLISIGKSPKGENHKSFEDQRLKFVANCPYSQDYWSLISAQLAIKISNVYLPPKKVLILDLDNTFWGGVLGEDGEKNLKFGLNDSISYCYHQIQLNVASLIKRGVLVGVCSKNNIADVKNLFERRKPLVGLDEFVSLKINWEPKHDNIKKISEELNLGTDSFVFVDDSEFEIAAVKAFLPDVETFKVSENPFEYLVEFSSVLDLFGTNNVTMEDVSRQRNYKILNLAKEAQTNFTNLDEYLTYLEMSVSLGVNELNQLDRHAQMEQRTNQFNLTTKRLEKAYLERLIRDKEGMLFSGKVSDRFGDHGMVFSVVVRTQGEFARIESFIQSCRTMGRGLEFGVLKSIFQRLSKDGVKTIEAEYIPSEKNVPCADFYKKSGGRLVSREPSGETYSFEVGETSYFPQTFGETLING